MVVISPKLITFAIPQTEKRGQTCDLITIDLNGTAARRVM